MHDATRTRRSTLTLDLGGGHVGEVDGRHDGHHLQAQPHPKARDAHHALLLLLRGLLPTRMRVVVGAVAGRNDVRGPGAVAARGGGCGGRGEGGGGLLGRQGAGAGRRAVAPWRARRDQTGVWRAAFKGEAYTKVSSVPGPLGGSWHGDDGRGPVMCGGIGGAGAVRTLVEA